MKRREFIKLGALGIPVLYSCHLSDQGGTETNEPSCSLASLFWVKNIPAIPYQPQLPETSSAMKALINLMSEQGLKFYRSIHSGNLLGPRGLINRDDVVLIKVNAQWKYRGCTNSDLTAQLIEAILDHPDGFQGEVVIMENGQGRGSLNCDTDAAYSDSQVHANAVNEWQSFQYLIDITFNDPRVSGYLLDPIRDVFIDADDHLTDGYRKLDNVSFPCFTTRAGNRIELKEGIWNSGRYQQNLKLINLPVLKHHDTGGSEITASLKHMYGVLSMKDSHAPFRHYQGLGETCGRMISVVRQPVLNIIDAIWVSHNSLAGEPVKATTPVNQILASQDPVALDYWAAKYILFPIDANERHHPDFPGINQWLSDARELINQKGGLYNYSRDLAGESVTQKESEMQVFTLDM